MPTDLENANACDLLTKLELEVLEEIAIKYAEFADRLRQTWKQAIVTDRKNTGCGFFTHFIAPTLEDVPLPSPVSGPWATIADLGSGSHKIGFVFWPAGVGGANCLEGFQVGDASGQEIDLETIDLAELQCREFSWPSE